MEIQCKDAYITDKGSLNLLQPTWTSVSTLYQEVLKFVNQFPFKKRLIFCFVFRGTRVKIDLGDVKAAGVVCVLGFGFGLGTLLIYKLYYKYIRPILDRDLPSDKSDSNTQDDNCCFYVDDPENEHSKDIGNINTITPPVFYEPEYAVCFNHNFKRKKPEDHLLYSLNHGLRKQDAVIGVTEGVKFRNRKTRRHSSEEQSDKDSAIGGVSELGQSFCSDVNRDSFYSTCTAESGFEDNSSIGCGYAFKLRYPSSTHSMNVNFSPKSLNDKHLKYLNDNPPEISSESVHSFEILEKGVPSPSFDKKKPSPAHVGHKTSSHVYPEKLTCLSVDESERSHSLSCDYDHLESLKSFSGTNSIGDWSCDEDGEGLSPLRQIRTSLSDYQFKQSVLQRLHEWSSFSDNYHSRSPTPDRLFSVRRSRSLDRNISDSMDNELFENSAIDFEDDTTKNLEHIEDELHDIQDEFSFITSKLCDLIRRGSVSSEKSESEPRMLTDEVPLSPKTVSILQKAWSRWERSPSVSLDSNRCSREGSVDLAWDMCELADGEMPKKVRSIRHQKLSQEASPLSMPERNSNNNSNPDASVPELKDVSTTAENSDDVNSSLPSDNLQVDCEPATDEPSYHSLEPVTAKLKNIGNVVNMLAYAEREWKGETALAKRMIQGYSEASNLFKCRSIRQIRGDNYCAIRSCLFQLLVSGINVPSQWSGIVDLINHLQILYNDSTSGLARWNFANRLPCSSDKEKLSVICKCVVTLYSTFDDICDLPTREEREKQTVALLNSEPIIDLELVEGIKILMLVHAMELYKANLAGQDVPVFVWLMFARDTSETVHKFVINHLNCVGDSGGLEQVEMCLLGHTLGTSIRVARLQNHGQQDFVSQFPDDTDPTWPLIDLLAEDDRHYNIPVP